MTSTIALTGATGFIGGVIARAGGARGWRIRALVRPASLKKTRSGPLAGQDIEWVEGSLTDGTALDALVSGADGVIHCAGAVRGARWADFEPVNVSGTQRLAEAAARTGVPRFLLLSSLAAREPALSDYALSKRRAEEALARAAGSMSWAALRPPAVYGPGDQEMRPLFEWVGRGLAPILGAATARFSLIYVGDLASAALDWVAAADPGGRTYELHDGHEQGYGWEEVVAVAESLAGRRARRLRVPGGLLAALGAANQGLARRLGYAPMLTPGKVRELRHPDWVCDNAVFAQATGWQPRTSLEQALRHTMDWGGA